MKTLFSSIYLSILEMSCASNDDDDDDDDDDAISYPLFGSEIEVQINRLAFDAMAPFISPSGHYLVFNTLNDGTNTKLYYAIKVNDSTFTFESKLRVTNQATPPHLDAVADMDMDRNFY